MRHAELMEATKRQPLLDPSDANIAKAKAFIMRKWIERAREQHDRDERDRASMYAHAKRELGSDYAEQHYAPRPYEAPVDLSSACKFSALFASILFGGRMTGNYDHYYVILPNKKMIDLNADAKDVQDMIAQHLAGTGDDPYREDRIFLTKGLRSDKRDVATRVVEWLNEFSQETGLQLQFQRTRSGAIQRR